MATEPLTTVSLDRDTAANLKQVKLQLERRERRSITLSEVVSILLRAYSPGKAAAHDRH